MANETSCVGCKFLYSQGRGYSNYTWEDTDISCSLDLNPLLPSDEPWDWNKDADNWVCTKNGRCGKYAPGEFVELDVDGENSPSDFTQDTEALAAIRKHSGRE